VHTGRSIWACTIISLTNNLLIKFVTPYWFDLTLNRPEEMLLGALLPFTLLALYEVSARQRSGSADQYLQWQASQDRKPVQEEKGSSEQNRYGMKVMAITLTIIGVLIVILGVLSKTAIVLVSVVGVTILAVAAWLFRVSLAHVRKTLVESQSKP
jgi:hypothetical protein